jgi:hypothetical protein
VYTIQKIPQAIILARKNKISFQRENAGTSKKSSLRIRKMKRIRYIAGKIHCMS